MVASVDTTSRWPRAAEFCSEDELGLYRVMLGAIQADVTAALELRAAAKAHRESSAYLQRLRARFESTPGGAAYRQALTEFFDQHQNQKIT